MYSITLEIPPQFLEPLDELVQQTMAGSRDQWAKNVIRNMIINYQVSKDFNAEQQKRWSYLFSLWP
jgi:metal-responsive CopG/Arc/MetJ family transcriptional regulator